MSICSIASSTRHAAAGDRLCERIQIHDHQLERHDALLGDGGHVVGPVAAAEDAAVDLRVERLDPAVHHLGKAGVGGHLADRDAGLFEMPPRAAAGEDFDARRHQPPGELDQARLVADADERSFNFGDDRSLRSSDSSFEATIAKFRSGRRTTRRIALAYQKHESRLASRRQAALSPAVRPTTQPRATIAPLAVPFNVRPRATVPPSTRGRQRKGAASLFSARLRACFRTRELHRALRHRTVRPTHCVQEFARRTRHATREPRPAASAHYVSRDTI